MVPKSFPFPIGVGVDICRISRIAAIIKREHIRNRWARKVFTRLEWPALGRRFQRVEESSGQSFGHPPPKNDQPSDEEKEGVSEANEDSRVAIWMLPKLSQFSSILEDRGETGYWSAIADERSALGALVRHLAGRWAAKEAAIKAHRHRQLYMKDVSIVRSRLPSSKLRLRATKNSKMHALIEPPGNTIIMDGRVATFRGLRGCGPRGVGLHPRALMTSSETRDTAENKGKQNREGAWPFERRSKVKVSDRQIAEVNISHDGDYAVAVCMAFDPPGPEVQSQRVVDYGEGPPLHEPQWGDEGWFEVDEAVSDVESVEMDDVLDGSERRPDTETYRKAFKEAFEGTGSGFGRIPFLP